MLAYPQAEARQRVVPAPAPAQTVATGGVGLGLIGAGTHVTEWLLPHLVKRAGVNLRWICTGTGINADALGKRFAIPSRTTDYRAVLADASVNAVLVGTRHDSHARIVLDALAAGKHVFVEKPLCLTEAELERIVAAHAPAQAAGQRLMAGFNRRYSPHGRQAREFFAGRLEPLVMAYVVNAGALPREHWLHDPDVGGGRIVGEGCHFIDFMQYVCGARPVSVRAAMIGRHGSGITADQCVITLRFADGSIGTLVYAAGGDRSAPKERFQAFGGGKALAMEEFVVTDFYEGGTRRQFKTGKRDKGFAGEMQQFCREVAEGGEVSMPFDDIVAVTRACILATRSLQTGDEYEV